MTDGTGTTPTKMSVAIRITLRQMPRMTEEEIQQLLALRCERDKAKTEYERSGTEVRRYTQRMLKLTEQRGKGKTEYERSETEVCRYMQRMRELEEQRKLEAAKATTSHELYSADSVGQAPTPQVSEIFKLRRMHAQKELVVSPDRPSSSFVQFVRSKPEIDPDESEIVKETTSHESSTTLLVPQTAVLCESREQPSTVVTREPVFEEATAVMVSPISSYARSEAESDEMPEDMAPAMAPAMATAMEMTLLPLTGQISTVSKIETEEIAAAVQEEPEAKNNMDRLLESRLSRKHATRRTL